MIAQKLGFNSAEAEFTDGEVRAGNRRVPLAEAARDGSLSAEDAIEYGDLHKKYQQSTFGAHFVEVGVDIATAEIRVRRMLSVCAAGRILNPKSARSQVIGAMTMGVGAALMEELVVDKRIGFFVNHDLAGYEVPVHADIPHQDVIFLDETDPMSSPMKAKGVAELGICGVAAAVANAIYNATGVRVRDYPITLDKLIDKLPAVGEAAAWPEIDHHLGLGLDYCEGGSIEEVRPGDVVWFPPGLKLGMAHRRTTAMTHIAIQELLNGRTSSGWKSVSDNEPSNPDSAETP